MADTEQFTALEVEVYNTLEAWADRELHATPEYALEVMGEQLFRNPRMQQMVEALTGVRR